jgi:hypothetical protein
MDGTAPGLPATSSGHADHPPAVPAFRKLDAEFTSPADQITDFATRHKGCR